MTVCCYCMSVCCLPVMDIVYEIRTSLFVAINCISNAMIDAIHERFHINNEHNNYVNIQAIDTVNGWKEVAVSLRPYYPN